MKEITRAGETLRFVAQMLAENEHIFGYQWERVSFFLIYRARFSGLDNSETCPLFLST